VTDAWHLQFLGDSAVRVCAAADDALVANAAVHRLAKWVRRAAVPGVRDVVPGMRDLVVHVDPLRCDLARLIEVLEAGDDADTTSEPSPASEILEVPVAYGGESGPDLPAVAALCRLSEQEVVQRHAAHVYRVCFIGFLPGFPYLAPLDPSLRLPRRATPRAGVPPGSIAIAGEYTGIYPWPSPGGWHLIGRTNVALFDVTRTAPSRLAPGDRVRFVRA